MDWREIYGRTEPIRAPRGLKYTREVELLLAEGIGTNGLVSQQKSDGLWPPWAGY